MRQAKYLKWNWKISTAVLLKQNMYIYIYSYTDVYALQKNKARGSLNRSEGN